jgi:oligopeptide/dipeptide ABC transporter ATP-binding protein
MVQELMALPAAPVGVELLTVDGLSVEIANQDGYQPALSDVSFTLRAGDTLGVVGESGSGKTMTALSIMGILPTAGRISAGRFSWRGESISARQLHALRGSKVSMVFQNPSTSLNPLMSVGSQITEVLRRHRKLSHRDARRRAVELLDLVGIASPETRLKQFPHEFSGGMRQRIMIAIALAPEPELLIADEPTTALDVTIQAQIMRLIKDLQGELQLAVMLITHDLALVSGFASQLMVLYGGRVAERAPTSDLFLEPRHPYTWGLMESVPHVDRESARLVGIPGAPPPLGAGLPGCPFEPRCPHSHDACVQGVPPLTETGDGRADACVLPADYKRRAWQELRAEGVGFE